MGRATTSCVRMQPPPDALMTRIVELLSDPDAMAEIRAARADAAAGRVVDAEELRAKYLHK